MAEIGARLDRKALGEVATLVKPETIMVWHRRLVAKKFDISKDRSRMTGPSRIDPKLEELVWGCKSKHRLCGPGQQARCADCQQPFLPSPQYSLSVVG